MYAGGIPRTVLTAEDIGIRIKAARLLRGISQEELARQMRDAGLPWRLAGSLERGEQPMKSAHRAALSRALGFPERWFTDPLDAVCPDPPPADMVARLERIIELLERQ